MRGTFIALAEEWTDDFVYMLASAPSSTISGPKKENRLYLENKTKIEHFFKQLNIIFDSRDLTCRQIRRINNIGTKMSY